MNQLCQEPKEPLPLTILPQKRPLPEQKEIEGEKGIEEMLEDLMDEIDTSETSQREPSSSNSRAQSSRPKTVIIPKNANTPIKQVKTNIFAPRVRPNPPVAVTSSEATAKSCAKAKSRSNVIMNKVAATEEKTSESLASSAAPDVSKKDPVAATKETTSGSLALSVAPAVGLVGQVAATEDKMSESLALSESVAPDVSKKDQVAATDEKTSEPLTLSESVAPDVSKKDQVAATDEKTSEPLTLSESVAPDVSKKDQVAATEEKTSESLAPSVAPDVSMKDKVAAPEENTFESESLAPSVAPDVSKKDQVAATEEKTSEPLTLSESVTPDVSKKDPVAANKETPSGSLASNVAPDVSMKDKVAATEETTSELLASNVAPDVSMKDKVAATEENKFVASLNEKQSLSLVSHAGGDDGNDKTTHSNQMETEADNEDGALEPVIKVTTHPTRGPSTDEALGRAKSHKCFNDFLCSAAIEVEPDWEFGSDDCYEDLKAFNAYLESHGEHQLDLSGTEMETFQHVLNARVLSTQKTLDDAGAEHDVFVVSILAVLNHSMFADFAKDQDPEHIVEFAMSWGDVKGDVGADLNDFNEYLIRSGESPLNFKAAMPDVAPMDSLSTVSQATMSMAAPAAAKQTPAEAVTIDSDHDDFTDGEPDLDFKYPLPPTVDHPNVKCVLRSATKVWF